MHKDKANKKPLYRKQNKKDKRARHCAGGEYKWQRNTKREKQDDCPRGSMHGKNQNGFDYTPLFKFLLSRIGDDWTETHKEAVARLDKQEPIFWMVALREEDQAPYVRMGENSYYSGLYIDENNCLAKVDPELNEESLEPFCKCCTHTFNGIPFAKPYRFRD